MKTDTPPLEKRQRLILKSRMFLIRSESPQPHKVDGALDTYKLASFCQKRQDRQIHHHLQEKRGARHEKNRVLTFERTPPPPKGEGGSFRVLGPAGPWSFRSSGPWDHESLVLFGPLSLSGLWHFGSLAPWFYGGRWVVGSRSVDPCPWILRSFGFLVLWIFGPFGPWILSLWIFGSFGFLGFLGCLVFWVLTSTTFSCNRNLGFCL